MKILWYVFVAILGASGILSLLRGAELGMTEGIGSAVVQLCVGVLFVMLAGKMLQKAPAA